MNTITLKQKKIYNDVSDSDDSTSGLDNNYAMLQHNERIAVKNDEKKHTQVEDTQAEDEEEKQKDICGEELNTAQYAEVKHLIQHNTLW